MLALVELELDSRNGSDIIMTYLNEHGGLPMLADFNFCSPLQINFANRFPNMCK